jgi:hypothetical protein
VVAGGPCNTVKLVYLPNIHAALLHLPAVVLGAHATDDVCYFYCIGMPT